MPCNPRDFAVQGQEVSLQIQFFDNCGKKVAADDSPSIRILDLDGNIILDSTSKDVDYLGEGLYQYIFRVPSNGDSGLWIDEWTANIDQAELISSFSFSVVTPSTGITTTTGPGKIKIADEVTFDYSDEELLGINIALKYLKARLRSTGIKPVRDEFGSFMTDGYGALITEECDVFDNEVLVCFLMQSLSEFNSTPFFTAYSFAEQMIQTLFSQIIVEGAYVYALASQALLEKGRDFTISDGGVGYTPPALGEFIQSHYGTWLTSYRERLKFIKNNIRPGPRSFGTHTNLAGSSPAFRRLRHLRSRQII